MKITKSRLKQLIKEAISKELTEAPMQSQFGLDHYFDAYDLEEAISAKMDDIRKNPKLGKAALTLLNNYITKLHNMPERGNKREKKMHGHLKRLAQDIRFAMKKY